ncbi:MAG: Sodium/hydrogen exchanger [Bryobacterales bacterium]|nr:Sodium/hydrogen exchanger [Bryobacterales bacterium]
MLLAQIVLILIAARAGGWLFRRIGQPAVVGEMAAGILLGQLASDWFGPLDALGALSQVGLVLFLFLVGLRLDLSHLRQEGRLALVTSNVSVLAPFALGAGLGVFLYPGLAHENAQLLPFALFLGAAMSITAFPVLARILRERGLEGTRLGAVAIACAAVDDVTAWLILAAIIAFVRSGAGQKPLWEVFALLCVYLASMWFGIRRLARDWSPTAFTLVLLVALISSLATDWLGVHALFGAFMAGVVMPKRQEFTDLVARKIEPLTVELLLPLFFVLTGLRTRIGLVQGWSMWVTCVAIIAIAVLGKWGGGMLAARWNGMSWRDASALGILMNTRGLVELVILNIGLDLGILSPALFSMMVIMALVTTFMTSPLLQLSLRNRGEHGRSAFSGR